MPKTLLMNCNSKPLVIAILLASATLTASAQTTSQNAATKKSQTDTKKVLSSASSSADGQTVFQSVEIEASVNINQWRQHLQDHLLSPIKKAAKKGMKAGTYTVNVRFLVEKDGSISDVRALDDPGFGLAAASEKVVKTGPLWSPGIYNGTIVRSYHTQPITFVISEK